MLTFRTHKKITLTQNDRGNDNYNYSHLTLSTATVKTKRKKQQHSIFNMNDYIEFWKCHIINRRLWHDKRTSLREYNIFNHLGKTNHTLFKCLQAHTPCCDRHRHRDRQDSFPWGQDDWWHWSSESHRPARSVHPWTYPVWCHNALGAHKLHYAHFQ